MTDTVNSRIQRSFDENDQERVVKYMDWLQPIMHDYVQNMRRSTSILILLIAVFELVVDSRRAQVSIGSFQITRDSIALVFLPALVAFLYLQSNVDLVKVQRLHVVFDEVFKIWSAKAAQNDLSTLLYTPQPAHWNVISLRANVRSKYTFDKFERLSSLVFVIAFLAGTLTFEAHAYYVLFPSHPSAIAAWAISLAVTLFCLVAGIYPLGAESGVD